MRLGWRVVFSGSTGASLRNYYLRNNGQPPAGQRKLEAWNAPQQSPSFCSCMFLGRRLLLLVVSQKAHVL